MNLDERRVSANKATAEFTPLSYRESPCKLESTRHFASDTTKSKQQCKKARLERCLDARAAAYAGHILLEQLGENDALCVGWGSARINRYQQH